MSRPLKRDVRRAVKNTSVEVPASEFEAMVQSAVANVPGANPSLYTAFYDAVYWTVPKETWGMFLDWSRIDKFKYVEERRDCDDFAKALWGNAALHFKLNSMCLIVDFSGYHAYNGVLTSDGEFLIIEPQTDDIVLAGTAMSASEAYTLGTWEMHW